jgi:hypothetical protein
MKKLTWSEMCKIMWDYNKEHGYTRKGNPTNIEAVVVFTGKGMNRDDYTEVQRSYQFSSDNKYFLSDQIGNSIFADCLDGTEHGVRLDWYIHEWEVDYCYMVEQ